MSAVQLQWTSSLREEYCPSAKAKLCTKVRNFSRRFDIRTKRRTVSPERVLKNPTRDSLAGPALMQKEKNTTVCSEHGKPMSEDCTRTNAKPKLSSDASDTTLSREKAKPQFLDGFSSTVDSTTNVRETSFVSDDRKWTRDVIFEAEKLVLESEIDQLNTPTSERRSEPHSLNKTKTNEKSMLLSGSVNVTNLREKSMSSPSLLEADNGYRFKGGVPVQRGVLSSQSQRDVTKNSSSSLVRKARRIGKSTSKSFHSLNNLSFFSTNERHIYKSKERTEEEGTTALLRAAKNDCLIQAQSLIGHGISTEVLDQRGWTPLFIALECENMECAELLVKLNANVNFVHENGMTILHKITSIGLYNGVKFLLRYGADTNAEDCRGWPAVHYAIRGAHLKCAAMLLAAGCDYESYTKKRVEEYGETIKMATVGKWKYHWQHKLDIDMEHEIHL